MGIKLARQIIALEGNIPGTMGESMVARQNLERMAAHVEWEAAQRGENEGLGRIPALFATLTSPVYKWGSTNRFIRGFAGLPGKIVGEGAKEGRQRFFEEANLYPAVAEWYVCLELKIALLLFFRI